LFFIAIFVAKFVAALPLATSGERAPPVVDASVLWDARPQLEGYAGSPVGAITLDLE
jgi:hypothetical protein